MGSDELPYESIPVESVDELLSLLRKSNPEWSARQAVAGGVEWPRSDWVFRGHGDAAWTLRPKVWRDGRPATKAVFESVEDEALAWLAMAWREFSDTLGDDPDEVFDETTDQGEGDGDDLHDALWPTVRDGGRNLELMRQAVCELKMVGEFIRFADELGHHVSDFNPLDDLDEEFIENINSSCAEWVYEADAGEGAEAIVEAFGFALLHAVIELTVPDPGHALAQHHGIDTRLLDWTRNPIVATFFAADTANSPDNTAESFAVFALRATEESLVEVMEVPRASSAFVHAQAGVFTWYPAGAGENDFYDTGRWPSLEDLLARGDHPDMTLKKIVVPAALAGEVIDALLEEGVSRAHLMPTLDNVAAVVNQRWASMGQ